ncbi:hypothetical protein PIB30_050759, partial [Stylosanthes scabra]|nr:hypothetical protein [Stylosanthes scabra]
ERYPLHRGITCTIRMNRKRKSLVTKEKGKLAMPPTRKSPPIAAARVETCPKVQENVQVPVVEPPKDIKGKRTARISVKPLRKRFFQRIIAQGGPSRPKPEKVEVIDLVSDDEEEKDVEATVEQPPLVENQAELEDEEEDPDFEEEEEDPEESVEPEETPSSYSLLSPFLATPELATGKYHYPHNWNFDEDLD